eukprot:gene6387-7492_t
MILATTFFAGRPLAETIDDVNCVIECLHYFSGVASTMSGRHISLPDGFHMQTLTCINASSVRLGGSFGYTRREPYGTCVGIGAWNYPLLGLVWKLAPAIAGGNALCFKPSEMTPLTALEMAKLASDTSLPAGAFNYLNDDLFNTQLMAGDGEIGQQLIANEKVAKVSFTGSLASGQEVYQSAAKSIKRVSLELGGKSALIVCEDANLDQAVLGAILANYYSNGQVCSNGTRVFVQSSILEKFTDHLLTRVKKINIGNPLDLTQTQMGPLISKKHLERVLRYVHLGIEEGATCLYGGDRLIHDENIVAGTDIARLEKTLCKGNFMNPCIFSNCTDDMTICKEEIFGPVLCLLAFTTDEEVIHRANLSPYGLASGIFTSDIRRGHALASQMKAGTVWINTYNIAPAELPWGGYYKSGIGRENGLEAMNDWTQFKSVFVEGGYL